MARIARLALAGPALALAGCLTVNLGPFGDGPLVEEVVHGRAGGKILLLDVDGALQERPETGRLGIGGRESVVARVRSQLDRARDEGDVRALLVRIHSPGGTVTASEILYEEIARFKSETGVPVVAQLMGIAASGGYFVAMAADTVRAYPTSVTGSIGVIFAGLNLSGLLEKLGVANQTLTAGDFKDAGSPLRPMRAEERAWLEGVLDDLFERFVAVVDEGRPDLTRSEVEALADGRIFSASQALEAGLVDALGDLPAAVEEARTRAGLEEARVVVYHRPNERAENLFSMAPAAPEPESALPLPPGLSQPAFLYLWWPGGP